MIRAGTVIYNLQLYRSINETVPAFAFPVVRVYRSTQGGRIKDRFTVQVTARSKGIYVSNEPGLD
jgi:hypothetical protein